MNKIVVAAEGILLAALLVLSGPFPAGAAHPKPGEYGSRGLLFNPAMLGIPLLDYFTGAPIQAAGPAIGGRYSGLPPFGTRMSCNVCHFDIVANESMNRHATMSFNKIALPQYGYGYDKEKPWVSGPGKFGKWSPAYNRQLGNMNATYASEAELLEKLDMGAFEFTTECGVCHVGGGPGSSNPNGFTFPWRVSNYFGQDRGPGGIHSNLDSDQRNQSIANDFIFPLPLSSPYYPRRVPLNPWDYFVKESGVQKVDWAQWGMNGTLQLDCLMCHLQGYDHLARNREIVRYNRLYNAGTLGSGVAVADPQGGEGFSMSYDASQVKLGSDGTLYLDSSFTDRISRFPKAQNCVHCHMPTAVKNQANVDWKPRFYSYDAIPSDDPSDPGNLKPARYLSDLVKRGDIWNEDEVHLSLDCAGCHTDTGKYQAWKPDQAGYMHSPGKGHDPMNTGSDEFGGTVKFCYDCHLLNGDFDSDGMAETSTFGAPSPVAAHAGAGLMLNIVPGARRIDLQGSEEEFTGNHLDVVSCTACHIRKGYAAARSVDFSTGSQFFNFVGNPLDQEHGPASVELAYTWKETTPQRLLPDGSPNPLWRRLIYPFNYVTGIYWNNVGSKDANGDGFTTGMGNNGKIVSGDPIFQRNVKENFSYGLNRENDRVPVALAGSAVFDAQSMRNSEGGVMFTRPGEIEAFKAKVTAKDAGIVPQLVLEAEPYLIMHNVLPTSSFALGKATLDPSGTKVYGCSDCHNAAGGIYKGRINMIGKGKRQDGGEAPVTLSWNNLPDVSTRALFWDRTGAGRQVFFADLSLAPKSTREPGRHEFLGYDQARVAALDAIGPAADYGLELNPKPVINPIADADPSRLGIQVVTGTAVPLSCPPAQYLDANGNGTYDTGEKPVGLVSYAWTSSDGQAVITGANSRNATVTFAATGSKSITLTVTDEEEKLRSASVAVSAIVPPISITWDQGAKGATFGNLPAGTATLRVYWGDGQVTTRSGGITDPLTLPHSYATAGAKIIQAYCYGSDGKQLGYTQKSITP